MSQFFGTQNNSVVPQPVFEIGSSQSVGVEYYGQGVGDRHVFYRESKVSS